MGNKMLIDATHPEETRVVALRGARVEEFDYESAARKQLRGNIYLAKVTRVEPSLQAAFVDYGGNRHGFLAFSEIHPDYYQIPVAEREALLEEQAQGRARRAARAAAAEAHAPAGLGEDSEDSAEDYRRDDEGGRRRSSSGRNRPPGQDHDDHEHEHDDQDHDVHQADEVETVGGAVPALLDDAHDHDHYHDHEHDHGDDAHGDDDPGPGEEEAEEMQEGEPHSVIALEAILPPRLSEELSLAIARAAEAADEIPLEGVDEQDEAASGLQSRHAGDGSGAHPDGAESGDHAGEENGDRNGGENGEGSGFESVGTEDALEELPQRMKPRRRYKIQEVIRRRQILLVQVVKEERGNKGAALTTYLSLAGRYTVLMPNTDTGGGISRKITQPVDRKRLKEIANELEVPEGMGLIIRTAGASRTKAEIKRDFEYLLRLWENVRELTLKSTAPALVYEEGNIIKRAIRDLYNKDIDEISVAGDDAYREAKDFMRMLMPSHAKNVQPYKEPEPIFIRYEVERQLNAMFSPYVTLRSGGYIVINQTEALVAIDVNSGKSTREHSIEDTALRTNTEAAEEIARQLRLRDLAGLIVIDFIDMEEKRNNRSVERRLKDCLRNDRARIQVGHISHFGLLEMSRQRLRTGVLEGSTSQCQLCQGTGVVRSTESVALWVLRTLEDTLRADGPNHLAATTSVEVALYILNHKRNYLRDIEQRYGVSLTVAASERMHGANFNIEKASGPIIETPPAKVVQMDWTQMEEEDQESAQAEAQDEAETEIEAEDEDEAREEEESGTERTSRRRRRRRRGREDRDGRGRHEARQHREFSEPQPEERPGQAVQLREGAEDEGQLAQAEMAQGESEGALHAAAGHSGAAGEFREEGRSDDGEAGDRPKRSRRRGRRGGRRQRSLRQLHEAGTPQSTEPFEAPEAFGAAEAPDAPEAREISFEPPLPSPHEPLAPEASMAVVGAGAAGSDQREATEAGVVYNGENASREEVSRDHGPAEVLPPREERPATEEAGDAEQRASLAVVEAPKVLEHALQGWGAGEALAQPPAAVEQTPTASATSPAARADRLRRRRKGWWQRRSNG